MKRQTLDQLSEIGQDVGQLVDNPKASQKINSDAEELTQRWDSLVQRLEDSSNQVLLIWPVCCATKNLDFNIQMNVSCKL